MENHTTTGKGWSPKDLPINLVINDQIKELITSMLGTMTKSSRKSILISGGSGVGKSTVINLLAKELHGRNWLVWVASAGDLMAGQRYIGDLEQNIANVLGFLENQANSLWIVPRFQELYYGGRHEHSPVGILDQILPHIESGQVRIIGEIDSHNLERIIQYRPQIMSVFEVIRIEASSKNFTLNLAKDWIKADNNKKLWQKIKDEHLEEIYFLAKQYLSFKENPASLIDLIKQTKKSIESSPDPNTPIQVYDFIQSLSATTGLPTNILDDREKLDLEELKKYFFKKVIGQEDAVNTLIERIAMIKAGLTDASRPSGVFLFVGPTGTGKTEIAKALAEYLFSSEERLIRLDMSEFQTQESTFKILGEVSEVGESSALVNRIRTNPFSVVLLDEFEKAHPKIWDLFLQVFDDGRLTDQRGGVADFRHAIIIITSNLGASMPSGTRIGFNRNDTDEIDSNVMKSIEQTFRPEFVNRLDKIVVFNPLSKSVAKQILKGELKKILQRRGLRQRKWELDLEDSAVEFLLDKGFSSTLGARPLKRAIEKYLLAPLAMTIVNHNFPKGDQFLLVGGGKSKLNVDFIDPNEPDYTWNQKKQIVEDQGEKSSDLSITDVYYDSKGILSEFLVIKKSLNELNVRVDDIDIEAKKSNLIATMSEPDFWQLPERFEVLSEIEFLDRFEAALETANNLFDRLNNPEKERITFDPRLIHKLSGRLYLMDMALHAYMDGVEQDAFLSISFNLDSLEYGNRLEKMYFNWAKSRNMDMDSISQNNDSIEATRYYSVSGFGAYSILMNECGVHSFEVTDPKTSKVVKHKIHVNVVVKEAHDYKELKPEDVRKRMDTSTNDKMCRRYRFNKSPVIKDLVKNWQTGKIEKVLAGDFDIVH